MLTKSNGNEYTVQHNYLSHPMQYNKQNLDTYLADLIINFENLLHYLDSDPEMSPFAENVIKEKFFAIDISSFLEEVIKSLYDAQESLKHNDQFVEITEDDIPF